MRFVISENDPPVLLLLKLHIKARTCCFWPTLLKLLLEKQQVSLLVFDKAQVRVYTARALAYFQQARSRLFAASSLL